MTRVIYIILLLSFVLFTTNDLASILEHVYAWVYVADDLKLSLQANLLSNCFMIQLGLLNC